MERIICKAKEFEEHVQIKVREDGEIKFYNIPFNNYFFIYEDDYEMASYWIKNYILEKEHITTKDGRNLVKIYYNDNTKRYYIRSILDDKEIEHFEIDVPADKRLVLDNFKNLHQDKLRYIFVDIETYDMQPLEKDMMGKVQGASPVLSFATKDLEGNTIFIRNEGMDNKVFIEYKARYKDFIEIRYKIDELNDDILNIQKKDVVEEGDTETINHKKKEIKEMMTDFNGLRNFLDSHEELVLTYLLQGERPLLEQYANVVKDYDVAMAYNGWGFDFPFLKDRFIKHNLNYEEISIIDTDYMEIVKANTYGERESNALQSVAEDELIEEYKESQNEDLDENEKKPELDCIEDVGKVDWKSITKAKKYFELFLCYPEIFKEYNIQDVNLLYLIENKLNYLLIHSAVCDECGCLLNDSIFNSKSLDNVFLRKYRERGLISPSKPSKQELDQRKDKLKGIFPGGGYTYIFEPGLHENLICRDEKSFYPTTVITYEISPEAFVKKVELDLKSVLSDEEIAFVYFAVTESKNHLDVQGKIKPKPYEKALEKYRKEVGNLMELTDIMFKFHEKYENRALLRECRENGWTMTPGDINYDTRGWKVYPHYIFKKAPEGKRNLFPEFSLHCINTRDVKKYEKKKYPEGSHEYESMDKFEKGIKRLGNCFSLDTEIMTVDGIKNITDVKVGDKVYSMNKKTREIEIATVIREIFQEHNGEMIKIKNRNTDLLVTPDHNMLKLNHRNKIEVVKAKTLKNNFSVPIHKKIKKEKKEDVYLMDFVKFNDYNYSLFINEKNRDYQLDYLKFKEIDFRINRNNRKIIYLNTNKFEIKDLLESGFDVRMRHKRSDNCTYSKIRIPSKDFSSLLGFYIADGSLYKNKEKKYGLRFRKDRGNFGILKRGVSKRITITKYDISVGRERIIRLIEKLGLRCGRRKKELTFSNDLWFEILEKCGRKAQDKNIPKEYKKFINYEVFFNSLYLCDGTKGKNLYSTSSDQLKNDLKEVCFLIGRNYNARLEETKKYRIWRISCSKLNVTKHIRKERISKIKDPIKHKKVACITLDKNNTIYVGRNDTFTWTGQSAYGFFAFKGSRYFMEEVPNAITSSCRATMKKSIIILRKNNLPVVGGDTDSSYYKNKSELTEQEVDQLFYDWHNILAKKHNCSANIELTIPKIANQIKDLKKIIKDIKSEDYETINSLERNLEEELQLEKEYSKIKTYEEYIEALEKQKKEFCDHFIVFEYEKTFDSCIYVAKKRYYFKMKKPDGSYKYSSKGGAYIKTDTLKAAGKMQKELCKDILDFNFDKEVWLKKIMDMRDLVYSKKLPVEDIVKIKGLKKPIKEYGKPMIEKSGPNAGKQKTTKDGKLRFAPIPAHVQVASRMEEDGQIVELNDKIKYIVKELVGPSKKIVPISPLEFYRIREYSCDYYWSNFESVLREILECVYPDLVDTYFEKCWIKYHKKLEKEALKAKKKAEKEAKKKK